jgi:hypothetical protein
VRSAGHGSKFKPVQQSAGDLLIPALLRGLSAENAAAPRVQSMAAAAVVNYAHPDACSMEDFCGHVPALMDALMKLLKSAASAEVCLCCVCE